MSVEDEVTASLKEARSVITVKKSENDPVNHPSHYNQGKIETIECIEAMLSREEFIGYLKGNILKYISRENHKGGLQDIAKAEWYSKHLVKFRGY